MSEEKKRQEVDQLEVDQLMEELHGFKDLEKRAREFNKHLKDDPALSAKIDAIVAHQEKMERMKVEDPEQYELEVKKQINAGVKFVMGENVPPEMLDRDELIKLCRKQQARIEELEKSNGDISASRK